MSKKSLRYVENRNSYELPLNESALKKLEIIERIELKGVACYFHPELPENWPRLTGEEKLDCSKQSQFDIKLISVFFKPEHSLLKDDIALIASFTEIEALRISSMTINKESVDTLKQLKSLQTLHFDHCEIDDSILALIPKLKNIKNLDIQTSNVSSIDIEKIKSITPAKCNFLY